MIITNITDPIRYMRAQCDVTGCGGYCHPQGFCVSDSNWEGMPSEQGLCNEQGQGLAIPENTHGVLIGVRHGNKCVSKRQGFSKLTVPGYAESPGRSRVEQLSRYQGSRGVS